MKLKHAFKVGLCVLTLCVSSFASSCEINCAAPLAHQHHSSATCSKAAVSHHDHCAHMAMRSSGQDASLSSASCKAPLPCWKTNLFASATKAVGNTAQFELNAIAFVSVLGATPATSGTLQSATGRQCQHDSQISPTVLRI